MKKLSTRLLFFLATLAVFFIFNLLVCHPVEYVRTESKPAEWTAYSNTKYGFTVDIPAHWDTRQSATGIELFDPASNRFISVKALPEESLFLIPPDEYAIERYPHYHPYLLDSLPALNKITVSDRISGYEIQPKLNSKFDYRTAQENWMGRCEDPQATITYFPSEFQGDHFVSTIECFTIGKKDTTYDRVVHSFRYKFPVVTQKQLLEQDLIDVSDTPDASIWYVGDTRGYSIDVDGDGTDELLIAGTRRSAVNEKEKGFFRLLQKRDGKYVRVVEKSFTENSFQPTDIKILNLDNKPGNEIFLRFVEYGNEWGKNSTVILFHDGSNFRSAEFGAFAEAKDLDGDGVDEIITSINTYFSLGAVAAWRDVYAYDHGRFVESNSLFKKYFHDTALPAYEQQLELVRNEALFSKVPVFRTAAYRLMYRLQKYIHWSGLLAEGKSIPQR
jgi:hypothetical protein